MSQPTSDEDRALVRLTVAGVSPLDNTARLGELPAGAVKPFPVVAGETGIGVIEVQGGSSSPVGTTVAISVGRYGISADGTWAELIAVDPRQLVTVPDQVDDVAAAALTTGAGYSTSYLALTEVAGFRPDRARVGRRASGVGGALTGEMLGARSTARWSDDRNGTDADLNTVTAINATRIQRISRHVNEGCHPIHHVPHGNYRRAKILALGPEHDGYETVGVDLCGEP